MHTLPLDPRLWAIYSDTLLNHAHILVEQLENLPGADATFDAVRERVDGALEARANALSILFALEPFEPFDHSCADALLSAMCSAIDNSAAALEEGHRGIEPAELVRACERWPRESSGTHEDMLARTFGTEAAPLDEVEDFNPGSVFEAYKYDNGRLLRQLAPHLSALGLPLVADALATVAIVGWIASAPDPVAAYSSMDSMLKALGGAKPAVADQVLDHLRRRERASRQARLRIRTTISTANGQLDKEARALAMADVYKRLVEGPVRHFGWALCCLPQGVWTPPPTLTPVREAMVAAGGFAQHIAQAAVLVDIRNGEAHENLEWDGLQETYVVESRLVDTAKVSTACLLAMSFDRGCEAAMACYRALQVRPAPGPPQADHDSRMPAWQRAETYFGTNGLQVHKAQFNARTAKIGVTRLDVGDINPCFQALLCARSLLPEVHAFEVYVDAPENPRIRLDASALDHALPVWNKALATFDMMPFSTFLPANLAARSQYEPASTAVRSVAWIATDDLLDALGGSPTQWSDDDVALFLDRASVVESALEACLDLAPAESHTRLKAVLAAVRTLPREFERRRTGPLTFALVNRLHCLQRVRHFWEVWGPVPRLPNIPEPPATDVVVERQPRRREEPGKLHWNTL